MYCVHASSLRASYQHTAADGTSVYVVTMPTFTRRTISKVVGASDLLLAAPAATACTHCTGEKACMECKGRQATTKATATPRSSIQFSASCHTSTRPFENGEIDFERCFELLEFGPGARIPGAPLLVPSWALMPLKELEMVEGQGHTINDTLIPLPLATAESNGISTRHRATHTHKQARSSKPPQNKMVGTCICASGERAKRF